MKKETEIDKKAAILDDVMTSILNDVILDDIMTAILNNVRLNRQRL